MEDRNCCNRYLPKEDAEKEEDYCETCIHRGVCRHRDAFNTLVRAVNDCTIKHGTGLIFNVSVNCIYFKKKEN